MFWVVIIFILCCCTTLIAFGVSEIGSILTLPFTFVEIVGESSKFLSTLVIILYITYLLGTMFLAIKKQNGEIIKYSLIIAIIIILFPMRSYVNEQTYKDVEDFSMKNYVTIEDFDTSSVYYFENETKIDDSIKFDEYVIYYNEETLKNEYLPFKIKFEIKDIQSN